ncbi:MAG: LAGLIDADG family homing endonuclease [Promethearchaeota archaeon]
MSFFLEENGNLAEMIGIILGDGHVHKKSEKSYLDSALVISLNRVDEPQYVNYVEKLIIQLFNIQPRFYHRKDSKSLDLKISDDDIIDFLISKGIKTGDKVKNQVSIPKWINKDLQWIEINKEEWNSKNRDLVIACIRGLIDTDGTVYVDHFNKIICIGFKNASLLLIKDFKNLCSLLGFRTGKITTFSYKSPFDNKKHLNYQVLIRAKSHVKNFLEMIKPMKWQYKKGEIEKTLKKLGTSIEQSLNSKYKRNDEF